MSDVLSSKQQTNEIESRHFGSEDKGFDHKIINQQSITGSENKNNEKLESNIMVNEF